MFNLSKQKYSLGVNFNWKFFNSVYVIFTFYGILLVEFIVHNNKIEPKKNSLG